jgi:hypothetical protein
MKIPPVGAELFRADGQTGRRGEGNSRVSEFWEKRLKIWPTILINFDMVSK